MTKSTADQAPAPVTCGETLVGGKGCQAPRPANLHAEILAFVEFYESLLTIQSYYEKAK
jgi:hypothetical protein